LNGNGGDDLLEGGGRGDFLFGTAGSDKLRGQDGDDCLDGGTRHDVLVGGGDNDLLFARDQTDDVVNGGANFDRARVDPGLDTLIDVENRQLVEACTV
jgi:Ca2+-binding RTX toxin-like protein